MNIGIYTRKSIYSDKSDSTANQAAICREYAKNNYTVTSIIEYEDEGYTGANTNRPGYTQLMNDIHNKKIDALVCYKIDRISRNVLDFSKTFEILQQHNVSFVSVKEQIDTSTPLGRAMMYICSVFAQMERETTAERVKDNLTELAKSGKWAGGNPPLGFRRERIVVNGKKHTTIVENPEDLPLLKKIFNTFLDGYSLNGLETHFKNNGIKSINGKYFSSTQLHQILRNPHYVTATPEVYDYFENKGCTMAVDRNKFDGTHGVMVYGRTTGGRKKTHMVNTTDKWIVTVGLHMPIISSDTWLSVQNRFGKNIIDKTRKYNIGLLKGILKCKCGYTMRVQHKIDKTYNRVYDYYYCQNRNRRGVMYCDMNSVDVSKLDDALLELLQELTVNKDKLRTLLHKERPASPVRNQSTVIKEINSVEKKISNLASALQDALGSTASKYIIAEIEKLDKQISGLNYELRELRLIERDSKKIDEDVDILQERIINYLKVFNNLEYNDKAKFLADLFSECTWDGDELFLRI